MSIALEKIKEVKKLLKEMFDAAPPAPVPNPAPAPSPAPAMPTTLMDGTPVSMDKYAVGGMVSINGVPAADGEYQLADGAMITVVSGAITNISTDAQAPAESAEMKKFKTDFATMQTEFGTFKQGFSAMSTEFATAKGTIGKQQLAIDGLLAIVEEMSKAPVAAPVAAPTNGFRSQSKEDAAKAKEEKLDKMIEGFKKAKEEKK
jgi:hypothetical protein